MCELYDGTFKSQRRDCNLALVDDLRFEVLPQDNEDARNVREIRAWLGAPAAHPSPASRDLTLVPRNLREFERIPGLSSKNQPATPLT